MFDQHLPEVPRLSIRGPLILPALLPLVLAACTDESPTFPTIDDVAGSYAATTLEITENGTTTDHLAQGAFLNIALDADGATTGRLFVPGADEDGGDFDRDMAGTWTLARDTVRFEQDADTFMRDMEFTFEDGRLFGSERFGALVTVVLERQ